ncbi:hypothetical protein CYY_004156 [Polysphondylium violaceum]|uniref:U3 snoRNP protein n=1 Tax=Polysphondylium violaceum TaxID=133409 RepID=A0A8J4PYP1_9MYCE|nr:hypothetical protein CYY_004156 [Polysphondylium violaceum]
MDKVFSSIDNLLDETLKVVSMGIINKEECRSIMKKREQLEIKITGRNTGKYDYLNYIKYELELDRMFHQRAKVQGIEFDHKLRSPLRHVLLLFSYAVKRFPKDESLWINFLNIRIKRTSKEGTGKTFAQALQHLPRSPRLWKLAASYEFETCKNIQSARNLIQAGIQFNQTDQTLWHYFFTMELVYISLLYNNIKDGLNILSGKKEQEESSTIDINLDKLKRDEKLDVNEQYITFGTEVLDGVALMKSNLIRGAIASLVYKNAIQQIKNDFDFRKQFYKIANKYLDVGKDDSNPIGAGELVQKEIIDSLKQDFNNDERVYLLLAKIELSKSSTTSKLNVDGIKKSIAILENGYQSIMNESFLFCFYQFVRKLWSQSISIKDSKGITCLEPYFCKIFEFAIEKQFITEKGYYEYIELLVEMGSIEKAFKASESSTNKFKSSSKLWTQRVNLYIKNQYILANSNKTNDSLDSIFEKAIKSVNSKDSENANLFTEYFKYQSIYKQQDFNKITELFKKLVKQLDGNTVSQNQLKSYLLDYTFLNQPKDKLKLSYQLCFQYLPIEKDFYKKCILYEEQRIDRNINDVRSLYERCFAHSKDTETKDTELWLNYRNFELLITGDVEKANTIANRAKKSLLDPVIFITTVNGSATSNNTVKSQSQ